MSIRSIGLLVLITIVIESKILSPAFAEMQILESNVPEYQVGSRIPDSIELILPAGGRVKVLLSASNETKVFDGPGVRQQNLRDIPVGGTRGLSKPATPRE